MGSKNGKEYEKRPTKKKMELPNSGDIEGKGLDYGNKKAGKKKELELKITTLIPNGCKMGGKMLLSPYLEE